MVDALAKLNEVEGALETIMRSQGEAAFDLYYRHADVDMATYEKKWRETLLTPAVAGVCEEVRAGNYGNTERRRAEVIANLALQAATASDEVIELKEEIEKIVIHNKPTLDGQAIPRFKKIEVLMNDHDRERRRRALFSEGALREALATRGRRLYHLRNEAARRAGYDDYVTLALAAESLTSAELEAIFERYERETRLAYEKFLAEGKSRLGLQNIAPWDTAFICEQLCAAPREYFPQDRALASLAEVLTAFGQDLNALGIALHADADIPYGGLCIPVHIPTDIRVLLNLKDGMPDYRVLYHEFGHAVQARFTVVDSFALKIGDVGFFNEAMADSWEGFISRPAWLATHTALTTEEVENIWQAQEMAFALRTRSFMAQHMFEVAAYRDPDGDLDAALDDYAERYLGYRYDDAGVWAQIYFPLLYPMYSKNYMLARVIARAVHSRLTELFAEPLQTVETFNYLADHFYAAGATLPWKEKLAAAAITI